ncbi:MAG: hypothetical protein ACXV8H_00230 [Chthoniobacterales bacterium]
MFAPGLRRLPWLAGKHAATAYFHLWKQGVAQLIHSDPFTRLTSESVNTQRDCSLGICSLGWGMTKAKTVSHE